MQVETCDIKFYFKILQQSHILQICKFYEYNGEDNENTFKLY